MKATEKAKEALVEAENDDAQTRALHIEMYGWDKRADVDLHMVMTKAAITAWLDGILADPEARHRITETAIQGGRIITVAGVIEALKQEAER